MFASIRNTKSPGVLLLVLALFGYSNCSKLQYEPEADSGTVRKFDGDLIDVTGACPAGRVPIGVTNNMEVHCARTESFPATDLCPVGYYIYSHPLDPESAVCLKIIELDRVGNLCPVNSFLRGYKKDGTIVCEPMPGTLPDYTCDPGYYMRGVQNSTAVCEPFPTGGGPVTFPTQCAPGEYLSRIEDGKIVCVGIDWNNFPDTQCPDGTALVGYHNNQPVCQTLMNRSSSPQTTCNQAQFAKSHAAGALDCHDDVSIDLVRFCGQGHYLKNIRANGFTCDPLPNTDVRFNGTCGVGKVLIGFANNEGVCRDLPPKGNLPGYCPQGTFPVGISNGQLVCRTYPWLLITDLSQKCTPNETQLCSVQNGVGVRACGVDGRTWSACVPAICNAGYELVGDKCQAVSCNPGTTTQCLVTHGSGTRNCKTDGTGYDPTCTVTTCDSGYRLTNNQCEALTCTPNQDYACEDGNGFGMKKCNGSGTGFGSCVLNGCKTGWTFENGACYDRLAPRITFTQVPANNAATSTGKFLIDVVENESGLHHMECKVDAANWANCIPPVTVMNLTSGQHTFQFKAIDNAGNVGTKTHTWNVQ